MKVDFDLAHRLRSVFSATAATQTEPMPRGSDVRAAVVGAYYPAILKGADTTRSRAQNAYAVAAAIATALVTAGALTGIEHRRPAVQIAGFVAVMAWIATALIFMLAIGGSVRMAELPPDDGEVATTADAETPDGAETTESVAAAVWVDAVVRNAREEARIIGGTIDKGWFSAAFASLVTVVALAFGFWLRDESTHHWQEARVALSKQGQATLSAACDDPHTKNTAVQAALDLDSLRRKWAVLKLPVKDCYPDNDHPTGPTVEITLPPAQIVGYARTPKPSRKTQTATVQTTTTPTTTG